MMNFQFDAYIGFNPNVPMMFQDDSADRARAKAKREAAQPRTQPIDIRQHRSGYSSGSYSSHSSTGSSPSKSWQQANIILQSHAATQPRPDSPEKIAAMAAERENALERGRVINAYIARFEKECRAEEAARGLGTPLPHPAKWQLEDEARGLLGSLYDWITGAQKTAPSLMDIYNEDVAAREAVKDTVRARLRAETAGTVAVYKPLQPAA